MVGDPAADTRGRQQIPLTFPVLEAGPGSQTTRRARRDRHAAHDAPGSDYLIYVFPPTICRTTGSRLLDGAVVDAIVWKVEPCTIHLVAQFFELSLLLDVRSDRSFVATDALCALALVVTADDLCREHVYAFRG